MKKGGIPFKSVLAQHSQEIMAWRRQKPPVTYHEIVRLLKENHGIEVTHNAVWSYVKRRSKVQRVMRRTYSLDDPVLAVPKMKDLLEQIKSEPAPEKPMNDDWTFSL